MEIVNLELRKRLQRNLTSDQLTDQLHQLREQTVKPIPNIAVTAIWRDTLLMFVRFNVLDPVIICAIIAIMIKINKALLSKTKIVILSSALSNYSFRLSFD
jgi:hypothetical protein